MQCPTCQNTDSRVLESRSADSGKSVRRRRECLNCSFRFTTYERVETMPVSVIKKDGGRELFDKQKLFTGISGPAKRLISVVKQLLISLMELNHKSFKTRIKILNLHKSEN